MATKPKLTRDTGRKISELQTDLQALLDEIETFIDEKSEKWRESDACTSWQAWADEVQMLLDAIDAFPEKPEI